MMEEMKAMDSLGRAEGKGRLYYLPFMKLLEEDCRMNRSTKSVVRQTEQLESMVELRKSEED